jgi:hypothetical protein
VQRRSITIGIPCHATLGVCRSIHASLRSFVRPCFCAPTFELARSTIDLMHEMALSFADTPDLRVSSSRSVFALCRLCLPCIIDNRRHVVFVSCGLWHDNTKGDVARERRARTRATSAIRRGCTSLLCPACWFMKPLDSRFERNCQRHVFVRPSFVSTRHCHVRRRCSRRRT